jgi:hypothetical protein
VLTHLGILAIALAAGIVLELLIVGASRLVDWLDRRDRRAP